jgi:hypothetical protein
MLHPFDQFGDESLDPPITKGERVTFDLRLPEVEDPLMKCFYCGSKAGSTCESYHGDNTLFCSTHTKKVRGLNQKQVDAIVKEHLTQISAKLKAHLREVQQPTKEISFEYAREDDVDANFDSTAVLKRVEWDIDV